MRFGVTKKRLKKRYIVLVLVIIVFNIICSRLKPAFVSLTHEYANNIVTEKVNESIKTVISNSSYELVKNSDNTLVSNTYAINILKSDIITNLTSELTDVECETVKIPIGSASGIYLLNGLGPSIPIKVVPHKIINSSIKDKFEDAGINFARYTVYLNVEIEVDYVGFLMKESEKITTEIPIIDNIISGNVPEYYGCNMGVVNDKNSIRSN